MNKFLKGLLVGVLVAITGPFGLIAVGVYVIHKRLVAQQQQTQKLTEAITSSQQVAQ